MVELFWIEHLQALQDCVNVLRVNHVISTLQKRLRGYCIVFIETAFIKNTG